MCWYWHCYANYTYRNIWTNLGRQLWLRLTIHDDRWVRRYDSDEAYTNETEGKAKRRRLFYKHWTMLAAKNKLRSWQYASIDQHFDCGTLWRVAERCVTLRRVAVRCGMLRCVVARCGALRCDVVRCGALQCVTLRYDALWYTYGTQTHTIGLVLYLIH